MLQRLSLFLLSPSVSYSSHFAPSFSPCSSSTMRNNCRDCTCTVLLTRTGCWELDCYLCSLLSTQLQPTSVQWKTDLECMLLTCSSPEPCAQHLHIDGDVPVHVWVIGVVCMVMWSSASGGVDATPWQESACWVPEISSTWIWNQTETELTALALTIVL